jgi:hypothetical protein
LIWVKTEIGRSSNIRLATSFLEDPEMNAIDIPALARHLFEAHGSKAIAEAAQKAASHEAAGEQEQARIWRQAEAALLEMQGPRQS